MQALVAFLTILFNTVLAERHLANADLYTVDDYNRCVICGPSYTTRKKYHRGGSSNIPTAPSFF